MKMLDAGEYPREQVFSSDFEFLIRADLTKRLIDEWELS
jgi:hypothetical protein